MSEYHCYLPPKEKLKRELDEAKEIEYRNIRHRMILTMLIGLSNYGPTMSIPILLMGQYYRFYGELVMSEELTNFLQRATDGNYSKQGCSLPIGVL